MNEDASKSWAMILESRESLGRGRRREVAARKQLARTRTVLGKSFAALEVLQRLPDPFLTAVDRSGLWVKA